MKRLFKLKNQIKHYDWGSPSGIPRFLGAENPAHTPWAEMWMGVHPEGPSQAADEGVPLAELIRRDPARALGPETQKRFGGLPFLFKLLAVEKPLSVQAHPNRAQAEAGFARENRLGIPRTASNRNYKDPNHKPELFCALGDFRALAGFRGPAEVARRVGAFARFASEPARGALDALVSAVGRNLGAFFVGLCGFSPELSGELSALAVRRRGDLCAAYPEYTAEWETAAHCAEVYPGDPGVLAPLYLNLVHLRPNQGMYLPAGVLHTYLFGFGLEVMANSDNVLRGALTSKRRDVEELLHILDFTPFCPEVLEPAGGRFGVPCEEFSLSVFRNQEARLSGFGPHIVIVTEGEARVRAGEDGGSGSGGPEYTLRRGESAFIPAADSAEGVGLSGEYTLYAAGVGGAG